MDIPPATPQRYLVPLAGPALQAIALIPKSGGTVIGRHEQCDITLPAGAERVSRMHARFDFDGSHWRIADLGSRCGTFINGVKLPPQTETLLNDGDLIRITPWTFSLSPSLPDRGLQSDDDLGQTAVRTIAPDDGRALADNTLALLLECAGAFHAARDEKELAELIIDAATRGTGLQNAVILRPVDAAGGVEIVASCFPSPLSNDSSSLRFSRSLIAAAAQGSAAEIVGSANAPFSDSMVRLEINSAICVPLMLGTAVAAFLYLDSRGARKGALPGAASAFCEALGRIASLALASLKRLESEKREAALRTELSAAAKAQNWIMPRRLGRHGVFTTIGESRAGQYVGGDFFDIIPLDGNRLAVAVGDVSGKGMSASVLMTATQGFLNAALTQGSDLTAAVNAANSFVNPRRPEGKFVTMWVGLFDSDAGILSYIDAGHGYAILHRADDTFELLNKAGGPPIGLDDSQIYAAEAIALQAGDRVMIVSDGIIEQFGVLPAGAEAKREQFHICRMQQSMTRRQDDPVAALFDEVIHHAGTEKLSDDATAVLVSWRQSDGT